MRPRANKAACNAGRPSNGVKKDWRALQHSYQGEN
jgi:hypothetical protein